MKAGGEGDERVWGGWMASPTQWTRVWVNSGSWWWTGWPGVLQSMGSQIVRHDWATEQTNWLEDSWLPVARHLWQEISYCMKSLKFRGLFVTAVGITFTNTLPLPFWSPDINKAWALLSFCKLSLKSLTVVFRISQNRSLQWPWVSTFAG